MQTIDPRVEPENFKSALFDELGISDNPKADLLFRKAWELGHANGYGEVRICAMDLVDLIK